MKFWGWILRILVVALGIGLFLLQSQFAKKSLLEFVVNQPFKNSALHVEAEGIRGLFPFQFVVSSLELKEGEDHLGTLTNISAVWLLPALMNREIKVTVAKESDLAGDISYIIGKHALFANVQGDGLSLGKYAALTSLEVDLPTLDFLKGSVKAKIDTGLDSATLSMQLEELNEESLKIQNITLSGKEINGKGQATLFPKQNLWEGDGELLIADLAPYDQRFQKGLAGSATLKGYKFLKGQAKINLILEQFHFGNFMAKSLTAQADIAASKQLKFKAQAQDSVVNAIAMTNLIANGFFDESKGSFEVTGTGPQNTSFQTQGSFELSTPNLPQTKITLKRADFTHPMHQFSLKQPTTFVFGENDIRTSKLWLAIGTGAITINDLIVGDELSGNISVDNLPLTLLRVIDPDWIASGYLSGKGKFNGTLENPDAELSLEGKSLLWGVPTTSPQMKTIHNIGIDLSSTFNLSDGFFNWQVKLISGRLFSLTSQGKISLDSWIPTQASTLDATLKGQGDMGTLSLFMPHKDLIQGQIFLDLVAKGTVKNPTINGNVSVANGLYENAAFGTYIKNIKIQGNASGNLINLSSISGRDASKGRVSGQGSIKFTSLLNPDLDIQLRLEKLIVVQNDEISGKASGELKLKGSLDSQEHTKAKITGDIVVQPLEIRLDEHDERIVTIKLLEKNKNGSFQTAMEYQKEEQLRRENSLFLPLDIKLSSPGQIYLRGYGFDAQWKGDVRAIGTIADPQLIGELTLVKGKFDLLGKPLKLTDGQIIYSQEPKNDPLLSIIGTREVNEITAMMRIEGHASDPKITFSSSPALPQEEVLARLLFGRGIESMSVTQSLLLANALSAFKRKNKLNFTDKIRTAFGLDVLEFKERKPPEGEDFKSATQQVSVGKQITDKVYLSIDQSVSGDGGTTATIQYDVTPSLKVEADVGGDKNTGVGFAWVKKY